jgi:UrcA family protein
MPSLSSTIRSRIFYGFAGLAAASMTLIAFSPAISGQNNANINVTASIPEDQLVVYVRYDDLSLTSSSGQQRLNWRIAGAVRQVCPEERLNPVTASLVRNCRTSAFSQATSQMNLAIDEARNGRYTERGSTISIAARR